jgi:hypothetical protein
MQICIAKRKVVNVPPKKKVIRATPSDGVNFIPYMKLLGVE